MKVSILNKAVNPDGNVITSFLLEDFPYAVLAEFNKHRLFSGSTESSRARPTTAVIKQIHKDPYTPDFTGARKGMSGTQVSKEQFTKANKIWKESIEQQILNANELLRLGIHKQDANEVLKPYMLVSQVVTATDYSGFFELRCAEGAKPAIRDFAIEMKRLLDTTEATPLEFSEWFVPWPEKSIVENVAACAGISYAQHSKDRDTADAQRLHDDLAAARHMVPFEHCAVAVSPGCKLNAHQQVFNHFRPHETLLANDPSYEQIDVGNFNGWLQYRKFLEYGIPAWIDNQSTEKWPDTAF